MPGLSSVLDVLLKGSVRSYRNANITFECGDDREGQLSLPTFSLTSLIVPRKLPETIRRLPTVLEVRLLQPLSRGTYIFTGLRVEVGERVVITQDEYDQTKFESLEKTLEFVRFMPVGLIVPMVAAKP